MKEQMNCCNGVVATGMDEKRAVEIVQAILSYGLQDCGVVRRPENVLIYGLLEMCLAAELLRKQNETRGKAHQHWVPDDKFIAAVFAISRYEPESTNTLPLRGIVKAPGRVMLCIATEDEG